MRTSSCPSTVEEGPTGKPRVGSEDRSIAGGERLSSPRATNNGPQPSTKILNLVDDNLNGRVDIPTILEYNMNIDSPISKAMMRTSSVSKRNSCEPITGDHSKSHTLLCEDPKSLRFYNLVTTFEPISGGCEIVTPPLCLVYVI